MRIEVLGITIIDCDFTGGEGIGISIFLLVVLLIILGAPLWKWW